MANRTTGVSQMLRATIAAAMTVLSVWTSAAPRTVSAVMTAAPAEAAKPAVPVLSSDNYLSALTFDQGVLEPAFISTTQVYTLSGLPYVPHVGVTYTAHSPLVLMVLANGCDNDTWQCSLVDSSATVAVFSVYAEDFSLRTYTVTIERAVSVPAAPLEAAVTKLSHGASAKHRCVVLESGSLLCWGDNESGQLGLGDTTNRFTPVTVTGVTDAIDVVVGDAHTCILRSGGAVQCMGKNSEGQLGDGTLLTRTTPVDVLNPAGTGPLTGVTHLSAGEGSTCATVNAKVWCWGLDLGLSGWNGSEDVQISTTLPLTVSGVSDAADIAVGSAHACALTNAGKVQCWGGTRQGQLGNGVTASFPSVSVPVTMKNATGTADLTGVTAIRTGFESTCVILANTQQMCVGDNYYYQTADGTQNDSDLPVAATLTGTVTAMTGISQSAPGDYHGCVLAASGFVYCAAEGYHGVLGVGLSYPDITAQRLLTVTTSLDGSPLSDVLEIASVSNSMCARTATAVLCWGEGEYGAVGNGLFDPTLSPAAVISIPAPADSLSTDASLSELDIEPGDPSTSSGLVPAFVSTTKSYTTAVPYGTTSAVVTATVNQVSATVSYSSTGGTCTPGNASPSTCALTAPGMTTITVQTTAQDGTTTDVYTVVVTSPLSNDASLLDLEIHPGPLSPAFVSSTTDYTASVPAGTTSVAVTATTSDVSATIAYASTAGSCTPGNASPSTCDIAPTGTTTMTVTSTAPDGTTQEYVIVVRVEDLTGPHASELVIDIPGLTPAFVSTTLNYQTEVPSGTNTLVVTPTLSVGATAAYSSTAGACTVNGPVAKQAAPSVAPQSATCPLFPTASTTVTVGVTDGTTTQNYTILATRASAPGAAQKYWFPVVPAVQ